MEYDARMLSNLRESALVLEDASPRERVRTIEAHDVVAARNALSLQWRASMRRRAWMAFSSIAVERALSAPCRVAANGLMSWRRGARRASARLKQRCGGRAGVARPGVRVGLAERDLRLTLVAGRGCVYYQIICGDTSYRLS